MIEKEWEAFYEIINMNYKFYAHTDKNGRPNETLQEHTKRCQKYFTNVMKEKKMDDILQYFGEYFFAGEGHKEAKKLFYRMAVNVVTFHDMGKVNPVFQKNKMGYELGVGYERFYYFGSRHSYLSSLIYLSYYKKDVKKYADHDMKVLRHFMFLDAFIISRHHSNLNCFENFMINLQEEDVQEFANAENKIENSFFAPGFRFQKLSVLCRNEVKFLKNIELEKSVLFYTYMRLMYSLLVASDYYATTEYKKKTVIQSFGCVQDIDMIMKQFSGTAVNQKIAEYRKEYHYENEKCEVITDIDILRSQLFLDTQKQLLDNLDKNIFYLEAPTGSGKSNAAFNLSFRLIQENKKLKKIYYVYPFNTLIEQNYKILQKTFGKKGKTIHEVGVMNSLTPIKTKRVEEDNSQLYDEDLLNYEFQNYPIVLTTSVGFFELLFGEKQSSLYAFHQFCNSVVVLDEIQNYKSLIWPEIITFFTVFARCLHMKFIIMSATLPHLSKISCIDEKTVSLVLNRRKYFENPLFRDRVHINYGLLKEKIKLEDLYEHVKKKEKQRCKILMEFISKKTAYQFYDLLANGKIGREISSEIALMTGDNNGLEREELLEIINREEQTGGYILVATQVVEAGVDIDMDIGYKDISKVDSEEQFMGRINRSCKKKGGRGEVYFFDYDRIKQIYGNDFRINEIFSLKEKTMQELLVKKDFVAYYREVLRIASEHAKLQNEYNVESFFKEEVAKLNFPQISERMKLIDEEDWSMSVYLAHIVKNKDGEEFDGQKIWEQYKKLLKDMDMDYAKKQVYLSEIRCKMNYFIYRVKKNPIVCTEIFGELYYIEDGEKYFDNGRLLKERLEGDSIVFIDL